MFDYNNEVEMMSMNQSGITREEVELLYKLLLARAPDSEAIIASHMATATMAELVSVFCSSTEYKKRIAKSESRFAHFDANFDVHEVALKYEDKARQPMKGHSVNFYGVAIREDIPPRHALSIIEPVETNPLPANWHADVAEFGAVMRTIERALEKGQKSYKILELGCGWGCWMALAGKVAKAQGLDVHVIGIEGDQRNLSLAQHTMEVNGFERHEYTLTHGIAAADGKRALFYQQENDEEGWGLEPIFEGDDRYENAAASGRYESLPIVTFKELQDQHSYLDLLHVDIQGGERALMPTIIETISDTVGHVMMGSHSRQIEGEMHDLFLKHGWCLDIERPAVLDVNVRPPVVRVDGVQGWSNAKFY